MRQLKKIDFIALFLAIVFAINTTVLANTCTEAMFGVNSFVNQDKARIDSSYFNDNENEWTHKYIYLSLIHI